MLIDGGYNRNKTIYSHNDNANNNKRVNKGVPARVND